MKRRSLTAAVIAVFITTGGLGLAAFHAKSIEQKYIHAFSGSKNILKVAGSALARAAFRETDLLPVVGASEVYNQKSRYESARFFRKYPTGFSVFEIARGGSGSLNMAELVAGFGRSVRGKKIVLSYTPTSFEVDHINVSQYMRAFSRLHAYQLVFSTDLKLSTKRAAAVRMLRYQKALRDDPIVVFALKQLVKKGFHRLLYWAVFPIGKLEQWALEIEDHFDIARKIDTSRKVERTSRHVETAINWERLMINARHEQILHANNNEFGFDNRAWRRRFEGRFNPKTPGAADNWYVSRVLHSAEWVDLKILCDVLRDLKGKVLFVGRPMKAGYYDALGVSADARSGFYRKISKMVKSYGFQIVDFGEYENDKYFGTDQYPHTSRIGWMHVNKVLDDFYHGRPITP